MTNRMELPMKTFARINLSSAALRRGILVSSLALVAIVANAGWFGKDDTAEFKVGDSETEIIARIPEANCLLLVSLARSGWSSSSFALVSLISSKFCLGTYVGFGKCGSGGTMLL